MKIIESNELLCIKISILSEALKESLPYLDIFYCEHKNANKLGTSLYVTDSFLEETDKMLKKIRRVLGK